MDARNATRGWRASLRALCWGAALCAAGCTEDAGPGGTMGVPPGMAGPTGGADVSTTSNQAPEPSGTTGGPTDMQASTNGTVVAPNADAGAQGSGTPGLSCNVAPIFEDKCQSCHAEELQFGAPMPLVTHADVQGMGPVTTDQTVLSLIGARIHDMQRPMPPSGGLTEEEKAAIDGWLAQGAPSDDGLGCGATTTPGDGTDDPGEQGDWPPADADECFEFLAHTEGSPAEPLVVKAGSEVHPGIVYDAPWGDRAAQAVGFRPITDNSKVIHHWILYQHGTNLQNFLVGWAPGNDLPVLGDDVGVYLPSGEQSLYLDLHYYNVAGESDEQDRSGVEVCVAYEDKMRPNTATVFQSFSTFFLNLPPQQDTATEAFCRVQSSGPITVLDIFPHMHEYGYHAKLEVKRADTGEVEVWHDAGFAFDDQKVYPLDKVLQPGDVVKTTCSHRNTSNSTVNYGPDTGDEMCFNFVNYYPMGEMTCDFGSASYAF